MNVPFKSKEKKEHKSSKQKSLENLNDQLILAKAENDTTRIRLFKLMIERISNLKDS